MTLSTSDFEMLLQANRILSSKLDSASVLQSVLELATKVVKAEASSLLLLDAATNELYFDVALGRAKESVKQIRLKVGEGIAGWVAKERQPLIVNDVSKDKRFTGKVDKSTQFVTKSILAVPLVAQGKLIGVVEAINKQSNGEFSANDSETFEVFAGQAAVAIENARLFSEITQEKEKLNTIFTEMSDGVVLLDGQARVTLMNQAASRFLGVTPEKTKGATFGPALLPDFEGASSLAAFLNSKGKVEMFTLSRQAGKDLILGCLALRLSPSRDNADAGCLVIIRDVTEEKRGNLLKRNFLSLISHKLRTPLTVILGYAPMLASQAKDLNDFQKKAVKSISDQAENLSALVDKLLCFTTVESDSIEKKLEAKAVEPVVKKALENLEDRLRASSASVTVNPALAALPPVMIDDALLEDVFENLIENAIKFNDKDRKEIAIQAKETDGRVLVSVRDNGTGIPPEEQDKVFQTFYQVENSFTGQVPGAGLGLSFCKKVLDAMGGEIRLESRINEGTTVWVVLKR